MRRGLTSGRFLTAGVAVIVVVGLVGALPVAATQQAEEEPNDSLDEAQEVAIGETVAGELPAEDTDWFAFAVERGATINVSASAADGDRGTDFGLRGPDDSGITGARLSGGNDYFGTTAAVGGTYYVRTVGVSPGQGGVPYEFTVETYRTDDFEPNEDRENATEIGVGETVSGEVSVGDTDWFAFTVDAGETVNVTAAAEDKRGTEFNLVTPDGDSVQGTRLSGGRDYFGTTVATGGTYYVQTLGVSPDRGGGEYNFTVETYRTDGFEPNEDRGNATRLYENPFVPSTATLTVGDREWFSFPVEAGETVNVSAGAAGERRGTEFNLVTPDGNNVAGERLKGDRAAFGATADAGGTYYLQTVGVSPSRGGDRYNFTVDVGGETLGLPNDRFERGNPPVGNQNRENAPDVTSGTYTLGMVDDDRDVLAVDLDEGERVRAVVDFDPDENDLALELVDDSGTAVTDPESATGRERVAFTSPEGGTYYLRVTGESGAASTYELDVAVLERTDVTIGPGAVTVSPDTATTVNVTVTDATAGVENANLSLRSTDTSVLRIQSVDAVRNGSVSATVADDGGTATANVTGLNRSVTGTVTVAQVTVAAVGPGSATLEGDATVAARSWFEYPLGTVQSTSVEVSADGTTATGGLGPGFGALVSLFVVVGTVLLAARRQG